MKYAGICVFVGRPSLVHIIGIDYKKTRLANSKNSITETVVKRFEEIMVIGPFSSCSRLKVKVPQLLRFSFWHSMERYRAVYLRNLGKNCYGNRRINEMKASASP